MNLSEYNIGDKDSQSLLFVGESGTGKTIAAVDWIRVGDTRPVYVASCDGRMGSVAEWHRGRKDIEYDVFSSYDSLHEKMEELVASCQFQTLIVDPITNISSFLMRYSFGLRGTMEWDENTGQAVKVAKGKKKGVVNLTTIEDFGVEHRGLEDIILNMKLIQKLHNTTIIL